MCVEQANEQGVLPDGQITVICVHGSGKENLSDENYPH